MWHVNHQSRRHVPPVVYQFPLPESGLLTVEDLLVGNTRVLQCRMRSGGPPSGIWALGQVVRPPGAPLDGPWFEQPFPVEATEAVIAELVKGISKTWLYREINAERRSDAIQVDLTRAPYDIAP